MIKSIKWKVKVSGDTSFQPGIRFIKVKITLVNNDNGHWNGYIEHRCEIGEFTKTKNGAIYREYVTYNPITLATLGYLQLIADTKGDLPGRHVKEVEIIRCLDVLHRLWD